MDLSACARTFALLGLLVGCGPASSAPDAPSIPDDVPAPCDAADFARTLLGMEIQQQTEGDPAADLGHCSRYRGSISFLEVDEAACTLSGRFGHVGAGTGGGVLAGSAPYTCTLRDSAPTGVYCTAGDLGSLGGGALSMTFSAGSGSEPMLTLTLSTPSASNSCLDTTESVP